MDMAGSSVAFISVFAAVPAVIAVTCARRLNPFVSRIAGIVCSAPGRGSIQASNAIAGGFVLPVIPTVGSAFTALSGGLPLVLQPLVQFRNTFSPRANGSIEISVNLLCQNNLAIEKFRPAKNEP